MFTVLSNQRLLTFLNKAISTVKIKIGQKFWDIKIHGFSLRLHSLPGNAKKSSGTIDVPL